MKLIFKSLFVLTISIFIFSCGNHKEKEPVNKSEVKLDNGNLWIANTETTDGIKNMLQIINDFSTFNNLNSYSELKINLEKEFYQILSKCTMQGESHQQLHNFLVPMKAYFIGLNSKDIDVAKKNYEHLKNQLNEYPIYFK